MTDKTEKTTTIEPTSPLYLHPSDGNGSVVVEKLQGASNYRPWRRSFEIILASKRKLGFVTGAVKRDERDKVKQEAWETYNNMIISWIVHNVSDSIKQSIMYTRDTKQIWDQLQNRFQLVNGVRKYQVRKQLYETKQNGRSIAEYHTQMSILWEELENMNDLPAITQSSTKTQEFIKVFTRMQEEERLFEFLSGLDESYSPQRSHMLMRAPLPTVDEAHNVLQQEEAQRESMKAVKEEGESVVMYSKANPNSSSIPSCTVCGKNGHTKDECWHVKGFPSWIKKGGGSDNRDRKEYTTERRGGRVFRGNRGGRSGRHGGRYAGNVQQYKDKESGDEVGSNAGMRGITAHHIEELIKRLPIPSKAAITGDSDDETLEGNMVKLVSNNCLTEDVRACWIVDSGASNHVTGDKSLIQSLQTMEKKSRMRMPTGDTAEITHQGKVKLNNGIELSNVVYVPAFKQNLLSVHSLISEGKYVVHFYPTYCLIRRKNDKKIVGVGKASKGLYYLLNDSVSSLMDSQEKFEGANNVTEEEKVEIPTEVHPMKGMNKQTLWHHRLGHAPMTKIRKIEGLKGVNKGEMGQCMICPQAKFTKLSYSLSESRASALLELIHVDLWGAYRVETRQHCKYFITIVDDFSRMIWVQLLRQKSEAFDVIKTLVMKGKISTTIV
ncbi:Retrovirus-related Pol polyprotein from transposon RE2 [Bienertia sinuspersici]